MPPKRATAKAAAKKMAEAARATSNVPKSIESVSEPEAAQEPKFTEPEPVPEPKSTEPEPIREPKSTEPETTSGPKSTDKEPEKAADPAAEAKARMERFAALRARAQSSATSNQRAAAAEAQRISTPTSQLTSLSRKRDAATAKLQRLDMDEAGEDFERRRAWDWTVDESEAWDRRVRRKEAARDNNAFADYSAEANKTYKRQVKKSILTADARERYEREKAAAIDRAARSGGLDIVELEDGELIAVDRDGSFYSTADSTAFASGANTKPDKAAVDRLVEDLRKAEEVRLRKRRDRIAQQEDAGGDVTFINEKNKQFNLKLARFYDKYTSEVRDSFERGTMI